MTPDDPTQTLWRLHISLWERSLKAQAKSPKTIEGYVRSARFWLAWLSESGQDVLPARTRPHHLEDYLGEVIARTSPANAHYHYRNLRVLFSWLARREEITRNPFDKLDPPQVQRKITPLLTDEEITAVLATCCGPGFIDRRDTALIQLFRDTGARLSELHQLEITQLQLTEQQFVVIGKGGKIRVIPFGDTTALALAHYAHVRAKHTGSDGPALWLSARGGRALTAHAIQAMIARRGKDAGLKEPLHPHRFRHDFADRWKSAGGSEEGLMAVAGWSSVKMPRHYGSAGVTRRAVDEHRRLGIAER